MQRLTFIYFNGILVFAAILLFCTVGIVDAGEPVPNYFTGIAVSDNAIYTIRLTNETTTTANALIQYYTHQGALEVTTSFLVAVGTTNVYTVNNVVQSDFSGSAVVFSDQLLSAEMTLDTGNRAVTVPGQTQGESMLNLLGLRRTSTEASVFAVTNVSSTPATVVINYSGADCDETVQLNAFTMYVRSLLTNFCLGNNYQGAASISASSPARANELIATAVRYSLDTLDVVDASNGVTTPLAITLSQYGIINQAVPLLALTLLFVPTIGLLFRRRLQKGT